MQRLSDIDDLSRVFIIENKLANKTLTLAFNKAKMMLYTVLFFSLFNIFNLRHAYESLIKVKHVEILCITRQIQI